MYFSSDKARRCLGYTARPAEEALFEAIEWFRENGHGVRRPINAVVNLPQTRKV
jgi:hypothetical protein